MGYKFALAGALSALATVSMADVTFADSDFNDINTSVQSKAVLQANGGDHQETRFSTDGNPGAWMDLFLSWQGGVSAEIDAFGSSAWQYDPSVSGAITSFDATTDFFSPMLGEAPELLAIQNGKWFIDPLGFEFTIKWNHFAQTAQSSTAFSQIDPAGGPGDGSTLDFSARGGRIQFYWADAFGETFNSGTDQVGYDNVGVTLHQAVQTVPEPTTLAALGLSIPFLIRRSRRKRA
jgi:hypothetical protein